MSGGLLKGESGLTALDGPVTVFAEEARRGKARFESGNKVDFIRGLRLFQIPRQRSSHRREESKGVAVLMGILPFAFTTLRIEDKPAGAVLILPGPSSHSAASPRSATTR